MAISPVKLVLAAGAGGKIMVIAGFGGTPKPTCGTRVLPIVPEGF